MTYSVKTVWTYTFTGKRNLFSGLVQESCISPFYICADILNKVLYYKYVLLIKHKLCYIKPLN